MNSYKQITYQKKGRVAVVTLNRPDVYNAFTPLMGKELLSAFHEAEKDEGVGAIVLTGEGRGFCSGADIREFRSILGSDELSSESEEVNLPLVMFQIRKPFIGAINGPALGAGLTMLLTCDIRIASEKARLGAIFLQVGLVPEWGSTLLLPLLVGHARAAELVYTAKVIDANEAERIGLVNKVTPHDSLMTQTMEMARAIADGPPRAMIMAKEGIRRALLDEFKKAVKWETQALAICKDGDEFTEGINAFLEKRKPKFS